MEGYIQILTPTRFAEPIMPSWAAACLRVLIEKRRSTKNYYCGSASAEVARAIYLTVYRATSADKNSSRNLDYQKEEEEIILSPPRHLWALIDESSYPPEKVFWTPVIDHSILLRCERRAAANFWRSFVSCCRRCYAAAIKWRIAFRFHESIRIWSFSLHI